MTAKFPDELEALKAEYVSLWGPLDRVHSSPVPIFMVPAFGAGGCDVFPFPPAHDRPYWIYITGGLSLLRDGEARVHHTELLIRSWGELPVLAEVVSALAAGVAAGEGALDWGHTMGPGPMVPDSSFEGLLFVRPLDEPHSIELTDDEIRIIEVVPVTAGELEYVRDCAPDTRVQQFADALYHAEHIPLRSLTRNCMVS